MLLMEPLLCGTAVQTHLQFSMWANYGLDKRCYCSSRPLIDLIDPCMFVCMCLCMSQCGWVFSSLYTMKYGCKNSLAWLWYIGATSCTSWLCVSTWPCKCELGSRFSSGSLKVSTVAYRLLFYPSGSQPGMESCVCKEKIYNTLVMIIIMMMCVLSTRSPTGF